MNADTALLVVDVQKAFWSANEKVRESFPNFPKNIGKLIDFCRDSGIEVGVYSCNNECFLAFVELWDLRDDALRLF